MCSYSLFCIFFLSLLFSLQEVKMVLVDKMVRFSVNSVCDYCGMKRGELSASGFKEHYKSHLGLEFKCDAINCKKSFPTKKRLYSHRKNVHDPQLCCELCKDVESEAHG